MKTKMKEDITTERIEHKIIEKKDYIMPIFFLMLNFGFFIIISYLAGMYLYSMTSSSFFTIGFLIIVWFVWGWGIYRNRLWKPEKVLIIEHVIVGREPYVKKRNKSMFEMFKLWKKK